MLLDKLNDGFAKEKGGRHGALGHEFQRYWALCHLIKLDLEREDFVMLIEHVEDVAVVDSEDCPERIELFQIKKNRGKWTVNSLCGVKGVKGKKSIIAKLFESGRAFPEELVRVCFVSDHPVGMKLVGNVRSESLSEYSLDCIEDDIKVEINAAVKEQLGVDVEDGEWGFYSMIKSSLAISDLENHAMGLVCKYLDVKYPGSYAKGLLFLRALYSEISVKSSCVSDALSWDSMKRMRGITKAQLDEMSLRAVRHVDDGAVLDQIRSLVESHRDWKYSRCVFQAGRRFLLEKASRKNSELVRLKAGIFDLMDRVPPLNKFDSAEWIVAQLHDRELISLFGKEYALAATLYWMNADDEGSD